MDSEVDLPFHLNLIANATFFQQWAILREESR